MGASYVAKHIHESIKKIRATVRLDQKTLDPSLVGLLSHRSLLRLIVRGLQGRSASEPVAVREIMQPDVVTVYPDAKTIEAIDLMRTKKVACLPVVEDGKLVGIVTEHDFIEISRSLLEQALREEG